MDFEKLSQDQIKEFERKLAQARGRKGGQVKSDKKTKAGRANIAKASARLAEIRAAKRVLAGKKPKGQPSTSSTMTETS